MDKKTLTLIKNVYDKTGGSVMTDAELRSMKIVDKLKDMRKLKDNWDGLCAAAPLASTINNAIKIVQTMANASVRMHFNDDVRISDLGAISFDADIYDKRIAKFQVNVDIEKAGFEAEFNNNVHVVKSDLNIDDCIMKMSKVIKDNDQPDLIAQ